MDYSYLDREEYKDVQILRIEDNKNDLPFFIAKLDNTCNQSKHRHEFVQIIYVCKGKLKHAINNNIFDIFRGDIFIIPPYVPHNFIVDSNEKYEIIEFEFVPEFINEKFSSDVSGRSFMDFAYLEPFLVTEKEMKPRLNLCGSIQLEVEGILDEILKEYEVRDTDFELMVKGLLLKLLILLGREFRKDIAGTEYQKLYERHRDAIYNAIKYIDSNFEKEISIEEVSKIAMLSQSYLRYLFKQITQKTLTEYIQNLRITKAIELLKTRNDMRIIDICHYVGFNNISHFNRVFRQDTGVSPSAFRKGV